MDAGIPAEQIAIRTADVNELKNVDLMSSDCPVRYIITVNALKEGWDCPFAYILASLANKTSQVDVEQILGRILRLPHTRQHTQSALNMTLFIVRNMNSIFAEIFLVSQSSTHRRKNGTKGNFMLAKNYIESMFLWESD